MKRAIFHASLAALVIGCGTNTGNGVNIDASRIEYSAAVVQGPVATATVVVGLAGTLDPVGETLTVEMPNGSPAVALIGTNGSFFVTFDAAAGESARVVYTDGIDIAVHTVSFADDLSSLSTPTVVGTSAPAWQRDIQNSALVTLDVSMLDSVPPFVVYNEDTGTSLLVGPSETVILIEAAITETVCIFRLDDTADTASPTFCEVLAI